MTSVGVRALRQRASELLRRVEAGETIEITDRGRPVALLSFKGSFGDFRVCSPGHDGAITAMPSVLAASRIRSSSAAIAQRSPT